MLLEIRHVTQYHYERPVRESLMELWMQPQKTARQRLISFELDLNPAAQVFSYADSFGNAVYHFDVPQPHDKLTIIARSAVETEAPSELPAHIQRDLPKLVIGGAMYSETPANRMRIINSQVFHEGDKLTSDLVLQEIRLKSAVLKYKGYRYGVSY